MEFICVVDEVFDISNCGLVIAPGAPKSSSFTLRSGVKLLIRNPDGAELLTSFGGFMMIERGRPMDHVPFSLAAGLVKSQISIGAEVYLSEPTQEVVKSSDG